MRVKHSINITALNLLENSQLDICYTLVMWIYYGLFLCKKIVALITWKKLLLMVYLQIFYARKQKCLSTNNI